MYPSHFYEFVYYFFQSSKSRKIQRIAVSFLKSSHPYRTSSSLTQGATWSRVIIYPSRFGTCTWRPSLLRPTLSTSTSGPSCALCTRMTASSTSLNVAGTEQTPPSWRGATTTSSGQCWTEPAPAQSPKYFLFSECLTETQERRWL